MAEWQLIESAPRDGDEMVWLWRPGMRRPWLGHWSAWNRWWTTGEVDRYRDHVPCPVPTHWQPTPEPPTTKGEGE